MRTWSRYSSAATMSEIMQLQYLMVDYDGMVSPVLNGFHQTYGPAMTFYWNILLLAQTVSPADGSRVRNFSFSSFLLCHLEKRCAVSQDVCCRHDTFIFFKMSRCWQDARISAVGFDFLLQWPHTGAFFKVLIPVYSPLIGLLLDFVFQIRGKGSERTMCGRIPSPHQRLFAGGCSRQPPMNRVTWSALGGELWNLSADKHL